MYRIVVWQEMFVQQVQILAKMEELASLQPMVLAINANVHAHTQATTVRYDSRSVHSILAVMTAFALSHLRHVAIHANVHSV